MDDEYAAWSGMGSDWNFVETMPAEVYMADDTDVWSGMDPNWQLDEPQDIWPTPPAGQDQTGAGGTGNVAPTATPSTPTATPSTPATPSASSGIGSFLKSMFVDAAGKPNPMGILGAMALLTALNRGQTGSQAVGYQGGVPRYTATRQQTQYAADPNRRPGSSARQYFTPVQYVKKAAGGGLMNLAGGKYLSGATDGMADKIPATIENKQPARLSHGEFVIPADVVSHLGNGNSEAGAQRLYDMMDRIRKARTGTTKQGKQINPGKYTPA